MSFIAKCYFESMSFFYMESGFHFLWHEIVNSEDTILLMIGNVRQESAEECLLNFSNLGNVLENVRLVYVHMDGLREKGCITRTSDLVQQEEVILDILLDVYPFGISMECFQCDPCDSINLSKLCSLEKPLYCVYSGGEMVGNFQEHLPCYESLCL